MVVSRHHEMLFIWTEQCAASHAQCQQRERFGRSDTVLRDVKRESQEMILYSVNIIQAHLFL